MITDQSSGCALGHLEEDERERVITIAPMDALPPAAAVLGGRRSSSVSALLVCLAGPITAACVTFAVMASQGRAYGVSVVVFAMLLATRALVNREPGWAQVLPLMGALTRLVMFAMSALVVEALAFVGGLPGIDAAYVALIAGSATIADAAASRVGSSLGRKSVTRIAIIGGARVAESLDREMRLAGLAGRYEVVGRILVPEESWSDGDEVPVIGRVGKLAAVVAEHDLDLLLMSSKAPRMEVFEEVARTCLHLSVRMSELSSFYERVFCHVASAEINAAWFQYILHPTYHAGASRSERVLDLAVASIVAIFMLPLLAVFALLVRRDGGPALFRQTRIGEGGRPFTMYKLRTMRVGNTDTSWATEIDDRVTPVGAFLRRSHLDELPQLLNVLRGDMSIVGPRPEQPQLVDELELLMPFYQRRHLVKPGVTGWAQVRCGYAGSHAGTAWKLCHDLYYLKHRSTWLNMIIIVETVRTVFVDRQYTARPLSVDFILAPAYKVSEVPHASS